MTHLGLSCSWPADFPVERDGHKAVDPIEVRLIEARDSPDQPYERIVAAGGGGVSPRTKELARWSVQGGRERLQSVEAWRSHSPFDAIDHLDGSAGPLSQVCLGEPSPNSMVAHELSNLRLEARHPAIAVTRTESACGDDVPGGQTLGGILSAINCNRGI